VDRGPVQADRAQREHPDLLRQQQHLHEQPLRSGRKVCRNTAMVSWSGCRLPAIKRNGTDSYVARSIMERARWSGGRQSPKRTVRSSAAS